MTPLIDSYGRQVQYLRLSVTDRCNYRCSYCKPEAFTYEPRENILRRRELGRLIGIFARLGVSKVRVTGGEPMMRRNLPQLVQTLAALPGIDEVSLSTNGALLGRHAGELLEAGVRRVNVSLDTLDPGLFRELTRVGRLADVLEGLDEAHRVGLRPVKLNMVVMAGRNDHEIEAMLDYALAREFHLRFIETMPIGENGGETVKQLVPAEAILDRVRAFCGHELQPVTVASGNGPARNYRVGNGTIGVISALSRHFCDSCNRVRLTARGDLILCLGREGSLPLGEMLRDGSSDDELESAIRAAILRKPAGHNFGGGVAGTVPMSVSGG